MSFRRWVLPQLDKESAAMLAEECGLDPFLALMLTTRGIGEVETAMEFLTASELTADPMGFADMDKAVDRVRRAVDSGETIMVYGDYDADGVTSTVLLYSYLKYKGAQVLYYIPRREGEGYGLHRESIDRLAEAGTRLIITVDNGIAALDEVAYAGEKGIDVVVTDHHQPQERLPAAVAVVDPHRPDCPSEFKDYAGVGMAFWLVCALEEDVDWALEQYADLVALGTLADVMPLRGENRVLVRRGLERMNRGGRLGLERLKAASGTAGKNQTSTTAVFTLAPRINAAGRMGSPDKAAQLLLSENPEEASALAAEIQGLNVERQETEAAILAQVMEDLRQHPERLADRVLVVAGEGWHHGVVGIIAARLTERFGKPSVVLSVDGEIAKGSGRSIKGFSLFDTIFACRDSLLAFGGHELAAGVTLKADAIDTFREKMNGYAASLPAMPAPELRLDCKLRPGQLSVELLNSLSALEPYGAGNAAPVFGLFQMYLEGITPVGGGKHLRLTLSRDGARITAMKFGTTPEQFHFVPGDLLNLAVTLDKNEYKGTVSVSVIVKDIRYASTRQEEVLAGLRDYDRAVRRELTAEDAALCPDRELTARLYRLIDPQRGWSGTLEQLAHGTGEAAAYAGVRLAVEVLRQAGLIEAEDQGDILTLARKPVQGKADLSATPMMRYLQGLSG